MSENVEIIGVSESINNAKGKALSYSASDAPVLITGSSGTGKEIFAKYIHENGDRKEKELISISLVASSDSLVEDDLFGHVIGSYSGAIKPRKGCFELANQSTLFLDEIGDISASIQAKLLRVLQEKEFIPVGGQETIKSDFRLICATNRNLLEMISNGEFREDLYYRISGLPLHLEPLYKRRDDIPVLMKYFFGNEEKNSICEDVFAFTEAHPYHWPGNIRELKTFTDTCICLSSGNKGVVDLNIVKNILDEKHRTRAPQRSRSLIEVLSDAVKEFLVCRGNYPEYESLRVFIENILTESIATGIDSSLSDGWRFDQSLVDIGKLLGLPSLINKGRIPMPASDYIVRALLQISDHPGGRMELPVRLRERISTTMKDIG